jgi:hypothetical protein
MSSAGDEAVMGDEADEERRLILIKDSKIQKLNMLKISTSRISYWSSTYSFWVINCTKSDLTTYGNQLSL